MYEPKYVSVSIVDFLIHLTFLHDFGEVFGKGLIVSGENVLNLT